MADEKGTGKHPHKSSEEPYPHHEAERSGEKRETGSRESRESGGSRGSERSSDDESESLKEREYKDNKGETHHHTRTYEEQHK